MDLISEGYIMLTVCDKHIKAALGLLNVPHIQKLNRKYCKRSCIFCDESAQYKLFYSLSIETSLFKMRLNSNVSLD